MARYILRYRGTGPKPEPDVELVERDPDTTIVDSSSRMLLVECSAEHIESLVSMLPDWIASAERTISLPDPRPRVERGPGARDEAAADESAADEGTEAAES